MSAEQQPFLPAGKQGAASKTADSYIAATGPDGNGSEKAHFIKVEFNFI
jgi:hypothetical protein